MVKLLSHLLKQKKIIVVLLLFFVLTGLVLPNPHPAAAAVSWWWCATVVFCPQVIGVNVISYVAGSATDVVVTGIIKLITGALAFLPLVASAILNDIARLLLNFVFSFSNTVKFTSLDPVNNVVVALGWPIVRNFANMFVVLGFIVIAVATILRIEGYKAQQLLAKLIIAALLINFSLVICGLVIDASNIVTLSFLRRAMNQFSALTDSTTIRDIMNLWNQVLNTDKNPIIYIATVCSKIFLNILSAVIFFLFAFLFLFRIYALWILVILSPLAFISYVFPATQKIWSTWWSNFWQWCIIGIPGAFFLWLGEELQISLMQNPTAHTITTALTTAIPTAGATPGNQLLAGLYSSLGQTMSFLIPGMFLVIGFVFSLQMSAMGSNVAIGAFKGSAKYVRKGGKWAADKTGLTRRAQALGDGATRGLERAGILRQGTADANEAARHKAALGDEDRRKASEAKDFDERYGNLRRREETGRSGLPDTYDRTADVQEMAKDQQLGRLRDQLITDLGAVDGQAEYEAIVREANTHGAKWKDLAADDYTLAGFDNPRIDRFMVDNPINPTTGVAYTRDEASTAVIEDQLEQKISSMDKKSKARINSAHLTPELIMGGYVNQNTIRDFGSAPKPVRQALEDALPAIDAELDRLTIDPGPPPTPIPEIDRDRTEINRLRALRTAISRDSITRA